MLVLGIETSCDETAVALCDETGVQVEALFSQVDLHAEFGGVVPELASRDHVAKLLPMIKKVVGQRRVDGIAYTAGPGLQGALLVGVSLGRSLAYAWNVPSIGVHHMEGHLLAPMMAGEDIQPPFLALLVSGGHTLLVRVSRIGHYEILGQTLDDAAGEAFDKTAQLLGLGYPGGPAIAQLAKQGDPDRFQLPRPMSNKPGLDFSFSGLKTAVIIAYNKLQRPNAQDRADLARCFEEACVDALAIKCIKALKATGVKSLVVAGGVSANTHLRDTLMTRSRAMGAHVYFPAPEYCTDNGAMIAYAGLLRLKAGQQDSLSIHAKARWPLDTLEPLD